MEKNIIYKEYETIQTVSLAHLLSLSSKLELNSYTLREWKKALEAIFMVKQNIIPRIIFYPNLTILKIL